MLDQAQAHTEPLAAPLRDALGLAALFFILKVALHIAANVWQAHLGWGYFRDEPYYLLCGQRLDWGYVDHGPVVALQARVAILLFGRSLAGIRMLSALAGGMRVLLTGLLAWQMGARRTGQALAMTGVLLAPEFLGVDSFLSMNSFEPLFWMTAVFAVLRMVNGGSPRWWAVFGIAAGLGCENKPSMLLFLVALCAGTLLTPQRRILATRFLWIGLALAFLLAFPNLVWQAHHGWATLRFIHRGKVLHKNAALGPLPFLFEQVYQLNPVALPLWGTGVAWLLAGRHALRFRLAGWTYVIFVVLMLASRDAVGYYLAAAYPMVFAAGGRAWELWTKGRPRWILPAYATALVATALLLMPFSLPLLSPAKTAALTQKIHMIGTAPAHSGSMKPVMLQFYADRFGWQELADDVTRIYRSLPAGDQARAGILCTDYGEASAINFLGAGRGLPFAISGHNNYFLWGPHGETGAVMIVISRATQAQLLLDYASVEPVGTMDNPLAMPSAHRTIYLCRGRKSSLLLDWRYMRSYI